jgi:hypothetical protein
MVAIKSHCKGDRMDLKGGLNMDKEYVDFMKDSEGHVSLETAHFGFAEIDKITKKAKERQFFDIYP